MRILGIGDWAQSPIPNFKSFFNKIVYYISIFDKFKYGLNIIIIIKEKINLIIGESYSIKNISL